VVLILVGPFVEILLIPTPFLLIMDCLLQPLKILTKLVLFWKKTWKGIMAYVITKIYATKACMSKNFAIKACAI
jgi:hypothetical protein